MPVLSKGGKVSLTYGDNRPRDARVVLASPNGRSLLLAFEGALRAPNGGYFVETIPLLQVEERGIRRPLRARSRDRGKETMTNLITFIAKDGTALVVTMANIVSVAVGHDGVVLHTLDGRAFEILGFDGEELARAVRFERSDKIPCASWAALE